MNILIISFPKLELCVGGEDQISFSLKEEFEGLGHSVDICDRNNYDVNKKYDHDFVLSLNHPLKIIDKHDAIWASWVFNDNIGKTPEDILLTNNYDFYLTNSDIVLESFQKESIPVLKSNFPPSNDYFRDSFLIDPKNKKIDIIYLGNYNPEYKTLEKIDDYLLPCTNYNFEIYGGRKWKFGEQKYLLFKGLFDRKNMTQIYDSYYKGIFPINKCRIISDYAKIFINFNAPNQSNLGMINNRIFDLLSNGCFVITDDTPQQREIFQDCVEYSSGSNDLKDKLDFYLKRPDLIFEKQEKSLNFSRRYKKENTYKLLTNKIINFINQSKESILLERKKEKQVCFAIYVNDINLLDNCIKSIQNNEQEVKYKFFVHRTKRIHSSKIIQNNNIDLDCVVLVDEDIHDFKFNHSDFDTNDIIIPTYSNIIYPKDFITKILSSFKENPNYSFCKLSVVDSTNMQKKIFGMNEKGYNYHSLDSKDYLTYGFYCFINNNIFKDKVEWNSICGKEITPFIVENCFPNIIFDTEEARINFKKYLSIVSEEENSDVNINFKIKEKLESKQSIFYDFNKPNTNKIRYSILKKNDSKLKIEYDNVQLVEIRNEYNFENIIRDLQSHYTILKYNENIKWNRLNNIVSTYFNYDCFVFGKTIIIKTSLLYQFNPSNSLIEFKRNILDDQDVSLILIDEITYDIKIVRSFYDLELTKDPKGLKVAVLSMCGVSSFEDKYGIGGEHQVVHWLKDSFEKRKDVYLCQIFDTFNYDLMNPDDYDIIFSNSCWRGFSHNRKRKDNLTIFWHFNMDSGKATMETTTRMEYDYIWTNSYVGHEWLIKNNIPCKFKQLNASSKYHYPYPYESSLYKHDVVYIGGYQVHYKGKELIDNFIKPCCGKEFDFAIYGNRLWKKEVQKQALEVDSYFKPEFYDESFEPHYQKILPMPDFNILAKNTKIWVNFNAATQRNMQMANDRPIWGLACGAFFITDDTPEARKFYAKDKDTCPVIFSTGGQDLIDKIRYYLEHDEERAEIASRGPEFIKRHRLHTDDTVEDIISLYREVRT